MVSREVGLKILTSLADLDALLVAEGADKGKLVFPNGYLVHLAIAKPESYVSALKAALPRDVNVTASAGESLEDLLLKYQQAPAGQGGRPGPTGRSLKR